MYSDTVTVFNRYRGILGDVWYPTILRDVNVNTDKATIVSRYGEQAQDNAILNVRFNVLGGAITVDGKPYLLPKEWEDQLNMHLPSTITFKSGDNADFFYVGDFGSEDAIQDDDFIDGFYNYMNDKYDNVFMISNVAKFTTIPHFEIVGR